MFAICYRGFFLLAGFQGEKFAKKENPPVFRAGCGLQHLALKTGKFPKNGDPGAIRTRDVLLRRQTLYPTEVRDHVPKNLDISKLFGSLLIMIS